MTRKRRPITRRLAAEIFLRQMAEGYWTTYADYDGMECVTLACYLSREAIMPDDEVIYEHVHAFAMGGADDATNIRIVLKEAADLKTNGRPHTTYGSDKHEMAHAKRLADPTPPKGNLKGRGFQTNKDSDFKKPFGGNAVRRNDG